MEFRWETNSGVDERLREGWERVADTFPATNAKRSVTYEANGITYVFLCRRRSA